jgi:Repeat of unknown function (DUF346)
MVVLLILLSLVAMGIGIYGLVRGEVARLNILTRKTAALVFGAGFVFFLVGSFGFKAKLNSRGAKIANASSPAAVSWEGNRIDVFARGSDNSLQHVFYDKGAWSPWESLGGVLKPVPVTIS